MEYGYACKEIGKILAKFERESGKIVRRVEIVDIEVTSFSDRNPQWSRRVEIIADPVPGTQWEGVE